MTQSYIDPQTLQPAKFGQLYTDRNLRLVGEVKWNSSTATLQTQGLAVIITPTNGGAVSKSSIPDASYLISSVGNTLWVKFQRTAGSSTVLSTNIVEYSSATQPPPSQDWMMLAYRNSTDEIVMLNGFVAGTGPSFTKIGVNRANSLYDAVVGPVGNSIATHTTIQAAVNDMVLDSIDGRRILVLEGTYSISVAGGFDPNAAVSWIGKTVSIEGQGWGTVIVNGTPATLTRAFAIRSASATVTGGLGGGSRITNLRLQGFNSTIAFDGGVGFGLRDCMADVWMTSPTSYTAPTTAGTGTTEANLVREWLMPGYTLIETMVSSSTGNQVVTRSNQNLTIAGSASTYMIVQGRIGVGAVSAPTQALDVTGDMRTTTGILRTPASYFALFNDAGGAKPLKVAALTVSASYSDDAPTTVGANSLYVVGPAKITTTLNVGGQANLNTALVVGQVNEIWTQPASTNATLYINYRGYNDSTNTVPPTAFYRDLIICNGQGANIMTFTGASKLVNVPILTASQVVVTDSAKNLASLAYSSTNVVSTIMSRDGSGDFAARDYSGRNVTLSGNLTTATLTATYFRTSPNTASGAPTYGFTNATTTGMGYDGTFLYLSYGGVAKISITSSVVISAATTVSSLLVSNLTANHWVSTLTSGALSVLLSSAGGSSSSVMANAADGTAALIAYSTASTANAIVQRTSDGTVTGTSVTATAGALTASTWLQIGSAQPFCGILTSGSGANTTMGFIAANGGYQLTVAKSSVLLGSVGSADDTAIYLNGLANGGKPGGATRFRFKGIAGNVQAFGWNGTQVTYDIDDGNGVGVLKNFIIDHPTDSKRFLIHTCLEGPEWGAVYYRGRARIGGGEVFIKLPSYFESLVKIENRTVQLTCIDSWSKLYAESVVDGGFVVHGDRVGQIFDWEVKAERRGGTLNVEPLKSEVEVFGESPYRHYKNKRGV